MLNSNINNLAYVKCLQKEAYNLKNLIKENKSRVAVFDERYSKCHKGQSMFLARKNLKESYDKMMTCINNIKDEYITRCTSLCGTEHLANSESLYKSIIDVVSTATLMQECVEFCSDKNKCEKCGFRSFIINYNISTMSDILENLNDKINNMEKEILSIEEEEKKRGALKTKDNTVEKDIFILDEQQDASVLLDEIIIKNNLDVGNLFDGVYGKFKYSDKLYSFCVSQDSIYYENSKLNDIYTLIPVAALCFYNGDNIDRYPYNSKEILAVKDVFKKACDDYHKTGKINKSIRKNFSKSIYAVFEMLNKENYKIVENHRGIQELKNLIQKSVQVDFRKPNQIDFLSPENKMVSFVNEHDSDEIKK